MPPLRRCPIFVVQGVQMPAWVEHASGARGALALDMPLSSKDRVITGPGARALLRLADGSLVKLGQNGMLALDEFGQQKNQFKEIVTASLDALSGMFRFTAQALSQYRGEGDDDGQDGDQHRRYTRLFELSVRRVDDAASLRWQFFSLRRGILAGRPL